ncbi:MAG: AMP-binding protein [Actinomycetes bacterium]
MHLCALAGSPGSAALHTDDETVTYRELDERVSDRRASLSLPDRSVVALVAAPTTEFVVSYLALLVQGHVPLLVGDQHERLLDRWRPAALIRTEDETFRIERHLRDDGSPWHAPVHPDLALLMSTSGSSGNPKLVRLSRDNVLANATSIVSYLGLRRDDVGITTLPLNYCYGLSVLHSHLLAGASIVLSGRSVVDPGFVPELARHGVTNIAGVPHTFELMERAGSSVFVPSLRFLTQAGGRMQPARVSTWVDRCEAQGVSLFVMYGATEATARMSYVPPQQLREYPSSIGVSIPGGAMEVRSLLPDGSLGGPALDGDVGELVYRGPNVMMGYAEEPSDLSADPGPDELRTGDLGRRLANGLFEVVGRRSRFVKPFGLRVDLDDLERRLLAEEAAGVLDTVLVTGDDRGVVIGAVAAGLESGVDALRAVRADELVSCAARLSSLPPSAVDVVVLDSVPRNDRGKVDPVAVLRAARDAEEAAAGRASGASGASGATSVVAVRSARAARAAGSGQRAGRVRPGARPTGPVAGELVHAAGSMSAVMEIYTDVLGVTSIRATDTFVSLGGDSLSYVECSIRLEDLLGELPSDWHHLPVASFGEPGRRTWHRAVDTTLVLRAVSILTVVAGHMILGPSMGGAHLLLAVAGYNLSRFLLDVEPARRRWRAAGRSLGRIAIPAMAWVAAGMVLFDVYSWQTLLLVNDLFGPAEHLDEVWNFWFLEVLVQLTVLLMVGLSIPFLRAWERRRPYAFVLALVVLSAAFRWEPLQIGGWFNTIHRPHGAALLFLLGWLVHRSRTPLTRVATTIVTVVALAGYFREPRRDAFVIAGLLLLLWLPEVRLPRALVHPVAMLAAASLSIYITHYSVYPVAEDHLAPWPAFAVTVAAGVVVWWLVSRAARSVVRSIRRRGGSGDPPPLERLRTPQAL